MKNQFTFLIYFTVAVCFLGCSFIINPVCSQAMKPARYSYNTVYKALPKKYQNDEYIIDSGGAAKLNFATYGSDNTGYYTSVKHSSSNLYYCVNNNQLFTASKTFIVNDSMYNDELRARIGLAIHLGANTWKKKANSDYTTGNYVTDYYMTQVVIQSLIYKYGGKLKKNGIKYNTIKFKSNTGNLSKKTKALYKACCNAKFTATKGNFQEAVFSFNDPSYQYVLLNNDGYFISDTITCNTDASNGSVASFNRESELTDSTGQLIANNVIKLDGNNYNSSLNFYVGSNLIAGKDPGVYLLKVKQDTKFNRAIAETWKCSDSDYKNNQEVAGLSYKDTEISANTSMKLIIGHISLKKRDSVSGDNIKDAQFELLQYDDRTGEYIHYSNLTYIDSKKIYDSGNIYLSTNNKTGKFKLIETKPGKNYINDWKGYEFIISEDNYDYEIEAANSPILGKLNITKKGDHITFSDDNKSFKLDDKSIAVPKVHFELYADEDLYFKKVLIYKKNQKIIDIITDDKGEAHVNDLIPGKYYIKESDTNKLYVLDDEEIRFQIAYNNNEYSTITYSLDNHIKKCELKIYKYTHNIKGSIADDSSSSAGDNDNRIPLKDCKFGLYSVEDILDPSGNLIVKKDTLIKEGVTDKEGFLTFKDLIYADYYLKELEVPDGIIKSEDVIHVSKDSFELKPNMTDSFAAKIDINNDKQEYKIKLVKHGEHFVSSEKKETVNGSYYSYIMGEATLKNSTFSLYDNNDKLIATDTTDDNGVINFEHLEYGSYYCVEDKAPEDYELLSEPVAFDCTSLQTDDSVTMDNGIIEVKNTISDKHCDCLIDILKMGENTYIDKNELQFEFKPLEGVVYGIFQDFAYTFDSGDTLPKDSCVGYIITDSSGHGQFHGYLPIGKYYFKELKTLKNYELNQAVEYFEVNGNNNKQIHINLMDTPFKNYLSKSSVKIIKTDINTGKLLKGVEFTLYNAQGDVIGKYKTDKKGEIIVENLPYGEYYFLETKTAIGYYSSNNKYSFTLDSNEMVELAISNTPILKLGFDEHYRLYIIILGVMIMAVLIFVFKGFIIKTHSGNYEDDSTI